MLRAAACVATAFFCLSLFHQPAFATKPDVEKTFTFRLIGEPETLDWNRAHTPVETYLLLNLMEGLVSFDDDLKVVPALAQSWKVSSDGKTYTFFLRPGVRWSDGVELKAGDFVESWKRLLDPKTAAAYAYFLFDVEGAEDFNKGAITDFSRVGVKATDERTLQVRITRPLTHWIQIPTFWVTFPVRKDLIEKYGNAWTSLAHLVTLGPFQLKRLVPDVQVGLTANPSYYDRKAMGNIEDAIGQIVRDDSTALTLYETGKLDLMTDIAPVDLTRVRGRADLKKFPYLKTGYIGFVVDKAPMNHVHFRRAIAHAIDRSKFSSVLQGEQDPARSWIPPKMAAFSDRVSISYDLEKARVELKASGVSQSTRFGLLLPNTEKALTIGQFVQAELKKNLGVEVVLQPFDNKTFRAQVDLRSFPSFLLSWGADYPDPDNFMSMWMSRSGNNRTNWKNTTFDELVTAARAIRKPKDREEKYLRAQKLLQEEDAAILPLYYEPNLALVKPRVRGLSLNPLNYLYLKRVKLGT